MNPLWIFGAGGHAQVIIDALRATGDVIIAGVLDDAPHPTRRLEGKLAVQGTISEETVRRLGVKHAVIAVGCNATRAAIARRFAGCLISWATVVHPRAYVASGVRLGEGTVVSAGVVVQP